MSVALVYDGVSDYALCVKVLQHFGELLGKPTAKGGKGTVELLAGKTISGYVGGANPTEAGCSYNAPRRSYYLKLHIR